MADRCVIVDGVLLRVTDDFDTTIDSEDMAAAHALVEFMWRKLGRDAVE